jgi:acyl-CoA synthetase (AMP-forming)/AMP-acid ligase II
MNIPEKCQQYLDLIVARMRELLSAGEEVQAFAFLGSFSAGIYPVPMDMKNKDVSAAMLKELCKHVEPDFLIFISEAWGLDQTKVSIEEVKKVWESKKGIADHPNRIDVIMIKLETSTGLWAAQPQIRTVNGKRSLDDPHFEFMAGAEGRFASFLPRKGTMH